MEITRHVLAGLAAASMATAPAMAQAPHATAPAEESDELGGEVSSGAWFAVIGVIVVVVLAVIAATNDDEDPVSP